jgi:hypothetical protein
LPAKVCYLCKVLVDSRTPYLEPDIKKRSPKETVSKVVPDGRPNNNLIG